MDWFIGMLLFSTLQNFHLGPSIIFITVAQNPTELWLSAQNKEIRTVFYLHGHNFCFMKMQRHVTDITAITRLVYRNTLVTMFMPNAAAVIPDNIVTKEDPSEIDSESNNLMFRHVRRSIVTG